MAKQKKTKEECYSAFEASCLDTAQLRLVPVQPSKDPERPDTWLIMNNHDEVIASYPGTRLLDVLEGARLVNSGELPVAEVTDPLSSDYQEEAVSQAE